MAVNIKFYYTVLGLALAVASLIVGAIEYRSVFAAEIVIPVQACVVGRASPLTSPLRAHVAECLGWQTRAYTPICHGAYQPINITPLPEGEIRVAADSASLYAVGGSTLRGHVEVHQAQQMVSAQTATIYRNAKTKQVTKIVLLGEVRYQEPDRLMIARKAILHPQDKSGWIEDVLYRFRNGHDLSVLPAWGRASLIKRFANQNYLLQKATYSTCAPQDRSWQIEANSITLDHDKEKGVARNAVLRVGGLPVLYTPYLSFPTSKKRKSGFLMPLVGYSNVGGGDLALPFYWNIAPNYDATIVPHAYALRGLMMGGDLRFLTNQSVGTIGANVLPKDKAFNRFITDNQPQNPSLNGMSTDRWSVMLHDNTAFTSNLHMNINYQRVSDDYYLQDFSSNLSVMTENQLLQQGDISYTTDHWLFGGMVQSYQTLHPITQSTVSDIYERLPQLLAEANYNDLPFHANFNMLGEFDYYHWPKDTLSQPQGPRYHLDPRLSFPLLKPWGYMTPAVQVVENYYDVRYDGLSSGNTFNRTIPRYSLDSGLLLERSSAIRGRAFTQTLEPRLYYLNVPYQDQTPVPVYDSAYMIFNADQLFRNNRFSGFDRIGDTNQLSYALTSRWLNDENGAEKINLSVGQIRYFENRRVQLCYQQVGGCVDSPLMLGYVSPQAKSSPIASRGIYHISPAWVLSGDYVWDVYTHGTNNGNINFHYQPEVNHIVSVGYSYLSSGNLLQVGNNAVQNKPLNQATAAVAWPLTEQFSGLGAYSYNVSEGYNMMAFLGMQYDNCCWAMRLMGGRVFQSLSPDGLTPQYNNNVYFQILLKGLGSVGSSDPASTISSYLPGYRNMF